MDFDQVAVNGVNSNKQQGKNVENKKKGLSHPVGFAMIEKAG